MTSPLRYSPLPLRFFFLAMLALAGFWVHGYKFGVVDQTFYIPLMQRWIDASLFPNDYLVNLPGLGKYSPFWIACSQAGRFIGIETLFQVLYFGQLFLQLAFTHAVAIELTRSARAAWLAVLLWLPGYVVFGSSFRTVEFYLTARSWGIALSLGAFWAFLSRKNRLLAVLTFCAILAHPAITAPAVAGMAFAALFGRRGWQLAWLTVGAVSGAGLTSLFWAGSGSTPDPARVYDSEWLKIALAAIPEHFPSAWAWWTWGRILFVAASLLALSKLIHRRDRDWARDLCFFTLGVSGLTVFCLAVFPLTKSVAIIELAPARGLVYLMFLLNILIAGGLLRLAARRKIGFAIIAAGLGIQWTREGLPLQAALVSLLIVGHFYPFAKRRFARIAGTGLSLLLTGCAVAPPIIAVWLVTLRTPRRDIIVTICLLAVALFPALLYERRLRDLVPKALRIKSAYLMVMLGLAAQIIVQVSLCQSSENKVSWSPLDDHETEKKIRVQITRLIQDQVPRHAGVIVPPEWENFRFQTSRNSFVTDKDRGAALSNRAFAFEWRERMNAVRSIYAPRIPGPEGDEMIRRAICSAVFRFPEARLGYLVGPLEAPFERIGEVGNLRLYRIDCLPRGASSEEPGGSLLLPRSTK